MQLKTLIKSLPEPAVILIVGRRGSGKDVTAHQAARELSRCNTCKIPVYTKYIYVDLKPEKYGLPEYFRMFDRKFYESTIILLSDAHLSLYSREWGTDFNKTMDKIQTIARHRNIDIIYTTQQTRRLDINIVAGVDCILFKEPSLMAYKFERQEIKDMTEQTKTYFSDKPKKWKWEHALAFTHTGIHKVENIKKPYYWTEELSKAYGMNVEEETGVTTVKLRRT